MAGERTTRMCVEPLGARRLFNRGCRARYDENTAVAESSELVPKAPFVNFPLAGAYQRPKFVMASMSRQFDANRETLSTRDRGHERIRIT